MKGMILRRAETEPFLTFNTILQQETDCDAAKFRH